MQTFLPYADFAASAAALDGRRLGKQRVEALQIIRALTRETYGWKHHPAVLMWSGYEAALASYGLAVCAEWVGRGRADTCAATMALDLSAAGLPAPKPQSGLSSETELPSWLGDERLHRSHQASLVRKDPSFYAPKFPDADPDLPYFWPTHEGPGA
jgi:pyrimidine dimer DNA glycosylase